MKPIAEMSDEELRISVAEAIGWEMCDYDHPLAKSMWHHPDSPLCPDGKFIDTEELPDYPNDLNACAAFEETLLADSRIGDKDSPFARYVKALQQICGECKDTRDRNGLTVWEAFAYAIVATSKQRCLAFLQTKAQRTEEGA